MLMHGIMSSIAEFYSRNLANEVIKGMHAGGQDWRYSRQGASGLPKTSAFVNDEGREVRTVEVDP